MYETQKLAVCNSFFAQLEPIKKQLETQLESNIKIFNTGNSTDIFSQDNINNCVDSYNAAYNFALYYMKCQSIGVIPNPDAIAKLDALSKFKDFFMLYENSCKLCNYYKGFIEYNYPDDKGKLRNLFAKHRKNAALHKLHSLFSCCKNKQKTDSSDEHETAALLNTTQQSTELLTNSVKSVSSILVIKATFENKSIIDALPDTTQQLTDSVRNVRVLIANFEKKQPPVVSDVATPTNGLNATQQPLLK